MPKAERTRRDIKNDKLMKLKKTEKFVKNDIQNSVKPEETTNRVARLKPLRTDPSTREVNAEDENYVEPSGKLVKSGQTASRKPPKKDGDTIKIVKTNKTITGRRRDGDVVKRTKSNNTYNYINLLKKRDEEVTLKKKDDEVTLKKPNSTVTLNNADPLEEGEVMLQKTDKALKEGAAEADAAQEVVKVQKSETSIRDLKNNTRIDRNDEVKANKDVADLNMPTRGVPRPATPDQKPLDESIVYDNVKTPDLVLDEKTIFVLERKHYEIHKKIFEGSFGEVYKGYHKTRNQFVAIKITDLTRIDKEYREMFIPREAAQLSEVRHRHIICILDVIKAGQRIFVFTEWAEGGSLKALVQEKGPLGEDVSGEYYSQIASALDFVHNQLHLVHRSIKLNNIYLHHNYCKVSDFGFAKCFWDFTNNQAILADTIIGTEPYFSPQLIERVSFNPYANDVWASGVMLFAMLNNRYPFHAGKPRQMLAEQKTKDFLHTRFIKRFSGDLQNLITLHFIYDESKRITMADVLKNSWIRRHTK